MFSKSSIVSLFEAFNRYLAIYRVYFIGARPGVVAHFQSVARVTFLAPAFLTDLYPCFLA